MKKRTAIITLAAIIVAALVLFTFTVAHADGFKRNPEADVINKRKKAEAALRAGFNIPDSGSKTSGSGKSGKASGKSSGYRCDDSAGDKAQVAPPETDGEIIEGDTLDDEGRLIHGVWKDTDHVGGNGQWELIYWYYIDMEE